MCLSWLFSLWGEDPLRRPDPGADGLAEAEAAEEVTSPGFRWTEVPPGGYTLVDPYMRQQLFTASATTVVPPVHGGRQTRPAPPTTQPVVDGAGRTKSEMLNEAAGVISMLLPGNELVDELRVFADEYRQFEDHGPILDRLIAAAEHPE